MTQAQTQTHKKNWCEYKRRHCPLAPFCKSVNYTTQHANGHNETGNCNTLTVAYMRKNKPLVKIKTIQLELF